MKKLNLILGMLAIALGTLASAAACPDKFANGQAPMLTDAAKKPRTSLLCFSGYAVLSSGITRTPLWSAEHLTNESVHKAETQVRENVFHPEYALPYEDRALLADFVHSGFDRGHMAPSGDMPDPEAQHESFSLANMVAQNADNNRHLWAGIEMAVRALATESDDLYVITGPLFLHKDLQILNGRVYVPTHLYKIIYDRRKNRAGAYVVKNEATHEYQTLSVSSVERVAGINFFPSMAQHIKDVVMPLPKPFIQKNRY